MRIERIRIQNLRCLQDVTVILTDVTPLIGANGSGKSTVLRALEFFLGEQDFGLEDVTGRRTDLELRVSVTCSELPDDLERHVGPWLDDDGLLTITKVGEPEGGHLTIRFESRRRQVPDFRDVRALETAPEQVEAYRELRRGEPYTDLPAEQSGVRVRAAMADWERENPEACEALPDTSLEVGHGGENDIGRLIHLVSVPAVQDATAEAEEGRSNVFASLTELLVRSQLDLQPDLDELEQDSQRRYEEIVTTGGGDLLAEAASTLTDELRRYAPDSSVHLDWDPRPVSISMPSIRAELSEGGFRGEIGRQGHGVQRAYMFALLRALATARLDDHSDTAADADDGDAAPPPRPLLVLAIEEPELYQHPVRAQMLSGVLRRLATREDPPNQVIYATHSPYFVGLDLIDAIQLLRAELTEDGPPDTKVTSVDMEAAATELWEAAGQPEPRFTAHSLRSRLAIFIDTPVSEGLFASAVVLVEGQEDAALLAAGEVQEGFSFAEEGIAILPVGGKTCLDRPLILLRQLGIPVYVVFDGDRGGENPETNRLLLGLLDDEPDETPGTKVAENYSVFEETFQRAVRDDVGAEAYEDALSQAADQLGFAPNDGKKNATVLRQTFQILTDEGHESDKLSHLIGRISDLRR